MTPRKGRAGGIVGAVARAVFLLGLSSGCERETPVPAKIAAAAARSRALEVASASAAVSGFVPLGAVPVLFETSFAPGRPSSVCSPEKTGSCSLDTIEFAEPVGVVPLKRFVPARFVGWAADGATGTVPPIVFLELDGPSRYHAAAARITPRADVARILKAPALVHSGYDLLALFDAVEPGEYAVHVLQVSASGHASICDTRRRISVE